MRIANVNGRLALWSKDGRALDVESASEGRFGSEPQEAFERWDELSAWAEKQRFEDFKPVDPNELEMPVPRPRQVFALAANYRAHAAEAGFEPPAIPVIFTKFPSCLTGPSANIELPSDHVDWEIELVVVIGREASNIARADAWSVVAGVTAGQDLSERIMQKQGPLPQISMAKSLAGFGPIGPVITSVDELTDPDDLELGCCINDEPMQRSRTSDLVFSVPELIEHLSRLCTLYAGDLIFTGTPEGVGATRKPPRFLAPNDVLTSYVEGVGTMRNVLVTPTHITSEGEQK